jgi:putative glutathione S-transferase
MASQPSIINQLPDQGYCPRLCYYAQSDFQDIDMLKDGKWSANWHPYQQSDTTGRFVRQVSSFRSWITPDGKPGPEGQTAVKAEADRYHLYVNYICPWANRTLITRKLKKLESVVSTSVLEPVLSKEGWRFGNFPGASGADKEVGARYLHEIYTVADPFFTGRASVPVLWDKKERTIVNNESADIMRIFDTGFEHITGETPSLRPVSKLDEILALNRRLYDGFNNGVYRAGFAKSQVAYNEAVEAVFSTLGFMEELLSDGRLYLTGDQILEADIRFYVTLVRFDAAYADLFKCNLKMIREYEFLGAYLERLYEHPAFGETTHIDHIKAGYYSIDALNPSGIVPAGPDLGFLKAVMSGQHALESSAA